MGLCLYAWKTRIEIYHSAEGVRSLRQLDFMEYFAGSGNLSKACLQASLAGIAFDYEYSDAHDLTRASAVRLGFEALGHTKLQALIWLARHVHPSFHYVRTIPNDGIAISTWVKTFWCRCCRGQPLHGH